MRTTFAVMFLLAIMACTAGCRSKPRTSEAEAAEIPSATVVKVSRGNISHTLNLAGQFQPYQVIDVHAKVSGYIRHIYVDIGDGVRQGQVLAILEVPELDAQLRGTVAELAYSKDEITRAQHEVLRSQAELSAIHSDYVRLKQAAVTQPGLIAQQELDNAQSKDLASEAQVDAAKAALAGAQQQSAVAGADNERVGDLNAYTKVTAPLNGVVIWRYADTGALIQAGTSSDVQSLAVVKLSQSDLLRLRLPVPESAVRFIHEGALVNVRVDAVDRNLVGKVVRFTRDVSLATRTMETEIDVENNDLSLSPGMYANATLDLEHRDDVLTIPISAVAKDGARSTVLVVNRQNCVEPRNVQLGIQGSTLAEVTSGLSEGDRVITTGQAKYQPGETVKPLLRNLPNNDTDAEQGDSDQ